MTPSETRFKDAASFFALFVRSPWASAHVRTDEVEIYVARHAAASPMAPGASEAPESVATLMAPHLGTLIDLAEVGATLSAGQIYGRLDLLGETIELIAAEGGTVSQHLLETGALAEYGQPLLSLH